MSRTTILKYRISLSALVLLLYALIFPIPAYTETFNVTNEDELREALSIAESNGEDDFINLSSGTYSTNGETFIFESDEDFSLTIDGKGAGITILDGGNMDRVFEINCVSDTAVLISLKGLTIRNGFHASIPDDPSKSDGGGIYVVSPNLTIEDCEFLSNNQSRAGDGGGLFANVQNTLNLSGNLFTQNSAAFSGGGAYVSATQLILSGNEFMGNSAVLGDGGGLAIDANTMHLPATGSCDASITNNIFISNESGAVSHMGSGGGLGISLYCNNFDYKIINNTITLNNSEKDGGGISFTATADSYQGVMQLFFLGLYNNIIHNNFATDYGGDVFIYIFSDVQIQNFYSFNNNIGDLCNTFHGEEFCRENLSYHANNINEDPLFVDAEAGDVSLRPDSPCIDAGDPNAPDLPEDDIYGNPRGPIPDMGAVEYIAEAANNGGFSMTGSAAASSLSVFLALPVLMIIRRFVRRRKK